MTDKPTPFPFATVQDLKDRWPDFPTGGDTLAGVMLEDASQYILDVCAASVNADPDTRKRVVCSVVKRSMVVSDSDGVGTESIQQGAGPYQETRRFTNPHGDFYLTKQEKLALGCGQVAFGVSIIPERKRFWL